MAEGSRSDDVLHADQACTWMCPACTSIRAVHQTQVHTRAKESQRATDHDPKNFNLGCGRHFAIARDSAFFFLLELEVFF